MAAYAGKSHMLRRGFLSPSEKVLIETHASKWFFFPGPVVALVLLLVADYVAATGVFRWLPGIPRVTSWMTSIHIPFIGGTVGLPTVLLLIALVATLGVGLWTVSRMLEWISDVYAVTNERLIKQQGIITHNFKDIPIKQIHTVEVLQKKLSARILKYGTLEMNSLANLSEAEAATQSQGPMQVNRRVLDPYVNPRNDIIDEVGVEKWFSVPDPIRIQRTIERAAEELEAQRAAGS
jgi:membrane protein YdbS with pleckstrin-like domain